MRCCGYVLAINLRNDTGGGIWLIIIKLINKPSINKLVSFVAVIWVVTQRFSRPLGEALRDGCEEDSTNTTCHGILPQQNQAQFESWVLWQGLHGVGRVALILTSNMKSPDFTRCRSACLPFSTSPKYWRAGNSGVGTKFSRGTCAAGENIKVRASSLFIVCWVWMILV